MIGACLMVFFFIFLLQVSITFDPFLYLPVPLPQKQKVLSVFYFAKEPHKKPVKVRSPRSPEHHQV